MRLRLGTLALAAALLAGCSLTLDPDAVELRSCSAVCPGRTCGEPDACGGTCQPGSGCAEPGGHRVEGGFTHGAARMEGAAHAVTGAAGAGAAGAPPAGPGHVILQGTVR